MEGEIAEVSKIRKRGGSSTSSSSLVRRYRFKRAILVGKKCGSSTPVPSWQTKIGPPSSVIQNGEMSKRKLQKEVSVSARKLAATLWEINDVPSQQVKNTEMGSSKLSKSESLPVPGKPHLSDLSNCHIYERIHRGRGGDQHRRMSVVSQKLQLTDYCLGGLDSVSNQSVMEIEVHNQGKVHNGCVISVKSRLKDVSNGLTTSKELLKVLNRMWVHEEQHSSSISLVTALRTELDRARIQVDQMIRELRSNRSEIDYLMKHFAEEKAVWKSKQRERVHDAVAFIAEELDVEKKLRRQTERLNKKLGKELAITKESLSSVTKELESEKRAKEILEQVCDELARGIGEDRAEVEELKREAEKFREEVEKEREMLQLADVLREERVHMKLSEAKYQFEEKNAAVEKLRDELETYLRTELGKDNDDRSPKSARSKELEAFLRQNHLGLCENGDKVEDDGGEVEDGEEREGDDSGESDLHSIELNMDNKNRSYGWSYARGEEARDVSKMISSVDKGIKGRKSISEKIQWGSISLKRGGSNGMEKDLSTKNLQNAYNADDDRLYEFVSQAQTQDLEDESKSYRPIKGIKDRTVSGPNLASLRSFPSPIQQWGSQEIDSAVWGSPGVLSYQH